MTFTPPILALRAIWRSAAVMLLVAPFLGAPAAAQAPDAPPAPDAAQAPDAAPAPDAAQSSATAEGADAETPEVERLLTELSEADERAARRLERRIAQLWSRSGSDSMDYLLRRGREALNEEAYEKAIEHLTAVVTLDPAFAEGWNARATAYFLDDELWRSVADIQRALALEPRHFAALSGLATILERVGEDAGALKAARGALEINPNLAPMEELVERLAPKVNGRDI
jgi:tetratricopeptide (TPR) repeat protein